MAVGYCVQPAKIIYHEHSRQLMNKTGSSFQPTLSTNKIRTKRGTFCTSHSHPQSPSQQNRKINDELKTRNKWSCQTRRGRDWKRKRDSDRETARDCWLTERDYKLTKSRGRKETNMLKKCHGQTIKTTCVTLYESLIYNQVIIAIDYWLPSIDKNT